jgi:hypothetical protein
MNPHVCESGLCKLNISDNDTLRSVRARVHKTLISELRSLPSCFVAILQRQYDSRLAREATIDWAPWIIADILGVKITPEIEALADAWLLLHSYTLFLDDFLDNSDVATPHQLILASQSCLHRALTKIYKQTPSLLTHSETITHMLDEALTAISEEISVSLSKAIPNPAILYKKMSTLKIWALMLLHVTGRDKDVTSAMTLVQDLINGFQLLDDLKDWEEDWQQRRRTFMLSTMLDRIGDLNAVNNCLDNRTAEEIFAALVLTSAYTDTLASSCSFLKEALEASANTSGSVANTVIRQRINDNEELSRNVSSFISTLSRNSPKVRTLAGWKSITQQVIDDDRLPKLTAAAAVLLASAG